MTPLEQYQHDKKSGQFNSQISEEKASEIRINTNEIKAQPPISEKELTSAQLRVDNLEISIIDFMTEQKRFNYSLSFSVLFFIGLILYLHW